MKYRIAYRIDGKLEYIYCDYMSQVGGLLRGVIPTIDDWYVEVLGEDGEYHKLEAKQ